MNTKITIPNTFIVGQPKSGTSALFSFLRNHPDVCVASTKEPQYFCNDLTSQHYHLSGLDRVEENYLSLFEHCKNEKIIVEASTAYLYSTVAAKEIYSFNPNAKIIMVLREPVSFLYTYHLQMLRSRSVFEDVEDFATALSLENERKEGKKIPATCLDPQFIYYSDRIRYAEQVQRYIDTFSNEQLKVIIYEDFKDDNEGTYHDVLTFLGIDDSYRPEFSSVNKQMYVRSRSFKQVLDKLIIPGKRILKSYITGSTYKRMKRMYRGVVFSKEQVRPLDSELEIALKRQFKPEVEKLSTLLDRDLVKLWGYQSLDSIKRSV